MSVEICSAVKTIKYLYKYVYKGHDRAIVQLTDNLTNNNEVKDEIKQYLDCRYVAAPEACWRISGFNMHGQQPSVQQLQIHLQNQQTVCFTGDDSIAEVASRGAPYTTLTAFIQANAMNILGYGGKPVREVLYYEFPEYFVDWKALEKT